MKNWLTGKDPDAGKDWRWEEKGTTEDAMVGWHHDSMDMSLGKCQKLVLDREVLQSMGSQSRTQLNNWTEVFVIFVLPVCNKIPCKLMFVNIVSE